MNDECGTVIHAVFFEGMRIALTYLKKNRGSTVSGLGVFIFGGRFGGKLINNTRHTLRHMGRSHRFGSVSGTTFRFQVMPSTPENTQKARLVRAFCCLGFPNALPLVSPKLCGQIPFDLETSSHHTVKRPPPPTEDTFH
ncbi:hypothetical protein ALP01_200341 [Pseudomonas caricapapayae]|nr:hypothetical protein ALP01_200341 [Pseudomonas caricapapayae]